MNKANPLDTLSAEIIVNETLTPALARTMPPRTVLRSCLLQALAHQYGMASLQRAGISDERLDRVMTGLQRLPGLHRSTDAAQALASAEDAARPEYVAARDLLKPVTEQPTGVSVDELRHDALKRLILAAGARPELANDNFTTVTPFGLVFEPRRTTERKPVKTGEITELEEDGVYEDFDAEAVGGEFPCLILRATLSRVQRAPLCGTQGSSTDEILIITGDGFGTGSIPAGDLPVFLRGVLADCPDAFEEACVTVFAPFVDQPDWDAECWAEYVQKTAQLHAPVRPAPSA